MVRQRDVENFPHRLKALRTQLLEFMEEVVYPVEKTLMDHQVSANRWEPHPLVEDMKVRTSIDFVFNIF